MADIHVCAFHADEGIRAVPVGDEVTSLFWARRSLASAGRAV